MTDEFFKLQFRIPSSRLKTWNYSSSGYYFVTICTKDRVCYFGEIKNGDILLSDSGKMVKQCWSEIPMHYPNVTIDEFIIMPNHIHGIVVISYDLSDRRDGACPVSTNKPFHILGNIIGSFKSASSKLIHTQIKSFRWQSRFHDHIIRNENSLNKIRNYIKLNPENWNTDEENSEYIKKNS